MATGNTPCGIAIPQDFANPSIDAGLVRQFIPRAEALGYEDLWVQEQIIGDAPILEPVTLLTYAAALTTKPYLGTSVLITVIRNPVQLAKSLSSLDQLSNGRLIVGVGVGGPHVPEAVFGVSSEHRGRRFVESLEVMKALWTQPRATMNGEYWRFENVAMEPKPAHKPHPPLWFGAREAVALKRAARLGDGWMGAGSSSSADFVKHVELVTAFSGRNEARPERISDLQAGLHRRRQRSRTCGAQTARLVWHALQERRYGSARFYLGQSRRMYRQAGRDRSRRCATSNVESGFR